MIDATTTCPTNFEQPAKPLLIVLSGPSGAGKDAVLARMKEKACLIECIVTTTTRPRRERELDKIDYNFVSRDAFQEMLKQDEFLEHAQVYGNWYGLPKSAVRRALASGRDVIVKVDTQGAATIKKKVPQAVFIFLIPPTTEELVARLKERNTESPEEFALRTKTATEEIRSLPMFDYVIVNRRDQLDLAVAEIKAIIAAEKCRVNQREIKL